MREFRQTPREELDPAQSALNRFKEGYRIWLREHYFRKHLPRTEIRYSKERDRLSEECIKLGISWEEIEAVQKEVKENDEEIKAARTNAINQWKEAYRAAVKLGDVPPPISRYSFQPTVTGNSPYGKAERRRMRCLDLGVGLREIEAIEKEIEKEMSFEPERWTAF